MRMTTRDWVISPASRDELRRWIESPCSGLRGVWRTLSVNMSNVLRVARGPPVDPGSVEKRWSVRQRGLTAGPLWRAVYRTGCGQQRVSDPSQRLPRTAWQQYGMPAPPVQPRQSARPVRSCFRLHERRADQLPDDGGRVGTPLCLQRRTGAGSPRIRR